MASRKTGQVQHRKMQHSFRAIRDPFVADATNGANPTIQNIVSDANGSVGISYFLSPFGVTGLTVTSTASGSSASLNTTTVDTAHFPWLYNQARNFERYRVTRAVICFVGNIASTATGRIMLDSSTDAADTVLPQSLGLSTGGKVWDLAVAASKELRFNMDVDSAWKKCSSRTNIITTNNVAIPVSTVNDLIFSSVYVTVNGASPNIILGNMFIEYDVEFRDPISYGANA